MTPRSDERELVRIYARTRWSIDLPDRRVELLIGKRADLPGLPLPAAVVTAYNPHSEPTNAEANQRATARLLAEVAAAGYPHHRSLAHGAGPNAAAWDEPGFLLTGIDRATIVDLAGRYGQNAAVWIGTDGVPALLATREGFGGARAGELIADHT